MMSEIKFLNKLINNKFFKFINITLSFVAIVYLLNLILEAKIEIDISSFINMVYVFPLFLVSNYLIANGISKLSPEEHRDTIRASWFASMLGKYIPFKIGIPLLRFGNIKQNIRSYSSSKILRDLVLEQITILLMALMVGSIYFIENEQFQFILILVIFTFSLISLKTTKTDRFLFLSNTLLSQIFIVVGIYFFINLTYQEANLTLVFGYILSASISLVFIGAPAGIGIREYIAVLLFSNNFDQNFVLELIISLRILTVFMDLFSYLGYFIYKKINSL